MNTIIVKNEIFSLQNIQMRIWMDNLIILWLECFNFQWFYLRLWGYFGWNIPGLYIYLFWTHLLNITVVFLFSCSFLMDVWKRASKSHLVSNVCLFLLVYVIRWIIHFPFQWYKLFWNASFYLQYLQFVRVQSQSNKPSHIAKQYSVFYSQIIVHCYNSCLYRKRFIT